DIGDVTVGSVAATLGEGAYLSDSLAAYGAGGVGDVTAGDITVVAGEGAVGGYLIVSVTASDGSIGAVTVGDIDIDLEAGADMFEAVTNYAYLYFAAQNDIGGVTVGD